MSMCDYIFCDIGGMGIETKTLWILSKHFTTEYNSFNIFFVLFLRQSLWVLAFLEFTLMKKLAPN